jgi:hypothetical protein
MIELLVGAGITAVSYGTGLFTGRFRRKTARVLGSLPEICQCGHGSAFHDRAGCHHVVDGQILEHDAYDEPILWERVQCPCVRYVGPLSSYVPELDGEPAAIPENGGS